MKNKWRTAFWVLLVVFSFITSFLIYNLVDRAVTISYMRDGYKDTERDLKELSQIIEGKLTFSDFKQVSDRYPPDLMDSTYLGMSRIKITFDKDMKVKTVTSEW